MGSQLEYVTFTFKGREVREERRRGREKVRLPCRLRVKQDKDVALHGVASPLRPSVCLHSKPS